MEERNQQKDKQKTPYEMLFWQCENLKRPLHIDPIINDWLLTCSCESQVKPRSALNSDMAEKKTWKSIKISEWYDGYRYQS